MDLGTGTIDQLHERLRGEVVTPGDAGYEDARRVYNAMIDRRPAAVVRCVDTGDVSAAVDFARENELDLAIRGGGHSVPGFGTVDDGVVIDLSGMRDVLVDPERRTARAQGGATWGAFTMPRMPMASRPPGESSPRPESAGSPSAGASATWRAVWASRGQPDLAEVVTADGQSLVASDRENEDLFWAIRGGGGNFGVVTAFEFQLHPVAEIYGGPMFFELEDAGSVLRGYREFIVDAPEAFGGFPAWQIGHRSRSSRTSGTATLCWRSWRAGRDRSTRASAS